MPTEPIKPNAEQFKIFTDALLDAFPTYNDLSRFTLEKLGINLQHITDVNANLTTITSQLVEFFASQQNGLKQLLAAAREHNDTNQKLANLDDEWQTLVFEPVDLPEENPFTDIQIKVDDNTGKIVVVHGNYYEAPPPDALSSAYFANAVEPKLPTVRQERRLDAAIPSECTYGQTTEVRAMVALPDSEGLKALLPDYTDEGDLINKEDAHSAPTAPVEFQLDPETGKIKNTTLKLHLTAPDFEIKEEDTIPIVVAPEANSAEATFYLTPAIRAGRGRTKVELLDQNDSLLGTVSLITQIKLVLIRPTEEQVWVHSSTPSGGFSPPSIYSEDSAPPPRLLPRPPRLPPAHPTPDSYRPSAPESQGRYYSAPTRDSGTRLPSYSHDKNEYDYPRGPESLVGDVKGIGIETIAGEAVPFDTPNDESNLEEPLSINTGDFEYDVGEVVELLPPAAASPLERIIDESDLLPVGFLIRGAEIQRAVARVVLTKTHRRLRAGSGWGTGFMISDSLFMTNNHVVQNRRFFDKFRVQFNYQLSPDGIEEATESFFPDPSGVFHTNQALDYSLIQLQPNQELADADGGSALAGQRWGKIQLNPEPIFAQKQHFNIIQHPSGRFKEILQYNEISELRTNAVRYTSDTEPGSSGSPVFNNMWELVALHHAGGAQGASGTWLNNQGIRIDSIVAELRSSFADHPEVLAELGI